MPTPIQLVLGVAALVGLGVLFVYGRRAVGAWLKYRGTRAVVCPENRKVVAVEVDAPHAAWSAPQGRPELRLQDCTRWPEKAGCGQECLRQIESSPEGCRIRTILTDWYERRSCAFCGRAFGRIHWHDHKPALLAPDGALVTWDSFAPEQVMDVLTSHKPVCWDCHLAESFRRDHPDLVVERPNRSDPPPSMV
jgi:hypothetical protein